MKLFNSLRTEGIFFPLTNLKISKITAQNFGEWIVDFGHLAQYTHHHEMLYLFQLLDLVFYHKNQRCTDLRAFVY
jgi:hypothetical protein